MDKDEWFKQADYDMETAEFMFKGERYFYTVFMCHLSIEKALKGLIIQKNKEAPPKLTICFISLKLSIWNYLKICMILSSL